MKKKYEEVPSNMETSSDISTDAKNARFPFSIVWTTLPLLSNLIPIIGHTGICE